MRSRLAEESDGKIVCSRSRSNINGAIRKLREVTATTLVVLVLVLVGVLVQFASNVNDVVYNYLCSTYNRIGTTAWNNA